MTGWLLEHQAALQSYIWLGAFGLVALWESFLPLRSVATATATRWFSNLTLTALGALVGRICLPATGFAVAVEAERRGWGLLNQMTLPGWLSLAAAVAAIDLGNYGLHRLFHALPVLWRCHKIHHSDLDVDFSTTLRHHPIEYLLVSGTNLLVIVILGVPPGAVFVAATLDLVLSAFNHGNVAMPPAVDGVLRRALVTPDMHRIHHSLTRAESDRNFGNVFPWWDRLFATYQSAPAGDHRGMDLGLDEARSPAEVTLAKLLLLPFRSRLVVASA